MRRFAAALALAVLALPLFTGAASAHPLGNFTVNHLSHLTVDADAIRVRYILDLAEIPTLQEAQAGRIDGIASRLAADLSLRVNGAVAPLTMRTATVEELPGQAGLTTLRVTLDLEAPAPRAAARLDYRDATYAGRIGWHAVVVSGAVRDASVAADDPTNELRAYPADPSVTPPDITSATAIVDLSVAVRSGADLALANAPRFAIDASADRLSSFLRSGNTDPGALLAALVVAMILGALHALGPGHGKAMVGAYLVGSRGTPSQAVVLGLTVTVTHTLGVYALGAVTLVAAQYVLPEKLYPVLGAISGVLVVLIGASLLRARWSALRTSSGETHTHEHHAHGDGPGEHRHDQPVGLRGLLALGISGGLLPCPTALVVLLAAVSFHNIALGMVLVAAFSVGLAGILTGIGLAFVWGPRLAKGRLRLPARAGIIARVLPTLSAGAIVVAGLVIAVGAARGFV